MADGEVIPSRFGVRSAGAVPPYDAHHNALLRHGEVVGVIYPEDPNSLTKQFIEYEVLVTERGAKTASTRLYQHCFLASDLAGFADKSFQTLRAGDRGVKSGLGSKVLILCLNAEMSNPVIVSGIRDERDDDRGRKAKGHHLERIFNGVALDINNDGSWSVAMNGPTDDKGELRGSEEAAGTTVKVEGDGSFEVHTKDRRQYVRIDHVTGAITVHGDADITLEAQTIHHGHGATHPAVLGDVLVDLLESFIDEVISDSRPTPTGMTSGPPLNFAKYQAIKFKLRTALSQFVTVGKDS